MKKKDEVLIRNCYPKSNNPDVTIYRGHVIRPVKGDLLGKYELEIEVLEFNTIGPLKRVSFLVHETVGTMEEMEALWATACENCTKPDSVGIVFS